MKNSTNTLMLIKIIENYQFPEYPVPLRAYPLMLIIHCSTGRPSVKADACNNKELLRRFSTEHGFEFLPDLNAKLSQSALLCSMALLVTERRLGRFLFFSRLRRSFARAFAVPLISAPDKTAMLRRLKLSRLRTCFGGGIQ